MDEGAHHLNLIVLFTDVGLQQVADGEDADQMSAAHYRQVPTLGLIHDPQALFHGAASIHDDRIRSHHVADRSGCRRQTLAHDPCHQIALGEDSH